MKKKVLSLVLSLVMVCTSFVSPNTVMSVSAEETVAAPAVKYSTGIETVINSGNGAIVESNADNLSAFKNLQDFTMNAKFKVTGNETVQTLFFIGDSSKNKNYLSVWVNGSGNNQFGVESFNASETGVVAQNNKQSSVAFDDGEEHTFTYRHDKDGDIAFYIDGEKAWSTNAGNKAFTEGLFADGAAMYLGMGKGNRANNGNNYPFTGTLKDVEIYTSALSEEQIAAYHALPEEYENLVFKKENITTATAVTDANVNAVKDLGNGVISICYRVDKVTDKKTTLFALTDADAEQYFEVYINAGTSTLGVQAKGTSADTNVSLTKSNGVNIADTNWHTVSIRKAESGNKAIEMFVDGKYINCYTRNSALNGVTNADTISIASLKSNSVDSNVFAGAIDSVRVYAGTLTNDQIMELAQNLVFETEKVDDMTGATKTAPDALYYRNYDGSVSYRIPSLLQTKDGTMLALIDQRNSGAADNGNIDLMVRRREAGATTFDEGINIVDLIDTNNGTPCAFMIDACTLQDRETGRIFVVADMFPESSGLMNSGILSTGSGYKKVDGKDYQVLYKDGTEFGTIREDGVVYNVSGEKTEYTVITECEAPYKELGNIYKNGEYAGNAYIFSGNDKGELNISRAHYLWLTYSDDDGKTWSCPKDITPQIKEDWMLFIGDGPGVGLQLADGTLTFPVYTAGTNVGATQSSAMIYSTDGGDTWTLGESPVKLNGDGIDRDNPSGVGRIFTEAQAIQVKNGDVKLFMRNQTGKVLVATSKDGGKTWEKIESTPITDVYCQLSVVNYVKDGMEYVVVSNPGGPARTNGTITFGTVQEDGSISWTHSKMFKPGSYLYSCLTKIGFEKDGDMRFGLLYEDESKGTGNIDINYIEFDERWITNELVDSVQQAPKVVDYNFEKSGDKVTVEVTFDQTVMAAGEVGLTLNIGTETALAEYKDGSGSDTLIFEGTIPEAIGMLKVTGINTEKGYLENTINQEPENVAFDLIALNELQFVTATATSQHSASTAENTDGAAINVIDGNPNTYWHSTWGNASITLPQSITMGLAEAKTIYQFVYTPRQGGNSARIKDYELSVSLDGEKFDVVSTGTFSGGAEDGIVEFVPVNAKYVKLTALTSTTAGSCNMAEAKAYEYAEGVYALADKAKLNAAIDTAEEILESENNYSETVLAMLENVKNEAVEAVNSEVLSANLAENHVAALQKAIAALVDTTRGLEAIEEAAALLNGETVYTDASAAKFELAIEKAQSDLEAVITVKDVTDVVMKLKYEASLLVEDDSNEPDPPVIENLLKAGSISASEATLTEEQPFEKRTAGSDIFRIPCLITLKDVDYKGNLVAAADARYTEYRDFGGIDTIASVSKDGGKTWNYSFPIYFPDSNGSAGYGQATTAIDPAIVEGPDGTIYCFADMNPTGVTTLDVYPLVGTGFVTVEGKECLALTSNYSNASTLPTDDNTSVYEYYVGDFDENGYAKVLSRADHSESGYAVDEWYNIYTINSKGEYVVTLAQTQVNSDTMIQQNAFYAGSVLHVYNTGYIWCVKSYDGGMSWEDPEILNPQIKREDGKETALLVSPGQGITTSQEDIVVGAYNTLNSEDASIFYSTDNGATWKRSNDVNVGGKSSENEIIELPDGTLRMFYRSDTAKICYADITRRVGADGEVTYVIGEGKQTAVSSQSNCNVSAIVLKKTSIEGKTVILVSNPEQASGAWTRVNGKIFVFTLNEDNTMNHVYTYSVNEGEFAYSCLTELDNGNIGMLWEPGVNEKSAIRYDEFEIDAIIGKIRDLTLDAGDTYVVSKEAETAAEIVKAPDEKVATVTSVLEVSEGVIPLYDLGSVTASSLNSFSNKVNTDASLENAEFTFKASGNNWQIHNEATNTYLTNENSANAFFASSAADMKVTASTEKEDMFTICRGTGSRYIIFHTPTMTFNSNGNWSANYSDGTYNLVLLEKQAAVSDGDIIPGYKWVDKITDGAKYLIAHIWSDGSVIVLYPTNGTSNQTKLVGEEQVVKTSIVTITAVAPGTTTAKVGDITYNITVEDPTTKPHYAGNDLPTEGMTAEAGTIQASEGPITNLFDGNENTFYHSNYSDDKPTEEDFWITIELPEVTEISGIRYLPRQNNENGRILAYEISYSLDGTTWSTPVSGEWADDASWKVAKFGENVEAKYVKLFATDSKADRAGRHLTAAEIRVLKAVAEPEEPKKEVCEVFVDVNHGAWYEGSVQYVYDEEIIIGDGNVFAPDNGATRAMVAVILYRLAGSPDVTAADYEAYDRFGDLPKEKAWYSDAVAWALKEEVSTGDDYAMLYNPELPVTREQLAVFLWRYAKYIGEDVTVDKTGEELFGDTYVNSWAKEGFAWAVDREIIRGAEETDSEGNLYCVLNPQDGATRAQLARMLHRYIGGAVD